MGTPGEEAPRGADDLQRLHDQRKLGRALIRQLVKPQVLQQVNAGTTSMIRYTGLVRVKQRTSAALTNRRRCPSPENLPSAHGVANKLTFRPKGLYLPSSRPTLCGSPRTRLLDPILYGPAQHVASKKRQEACGQVTIARITAPTPRRVATAPKISATRSRFCVSC